MKRHLMLLTAILVLTATPLAQEPPCDVSPLELNFPWHGGAKDVIVTGKRAWVPAPVPEWIVIVGMTNNGDGPGVFTVGVPPNTGPERRGIIRVGGRVVTVSQKRATRK